MAGELFKNVGFLGCYNKSSALAEMGDRDHSRHWQTPNTTLYGCCAPFAGELGPCLTQCGLGRGLLSYQVAS